MRFWGSRVIRVGVQLGFYVLAAGCSGASGGSERGRLLAVHNAFESLGLGQMGHVSEGSLSQGGEARFPMELEPQCHTFVAFGGGGARNVDLNVLDGAGHSVATDHSNDVQASVHYCPTARGTYTVVLRMASGFGTYAMSSWRGTAASGGGEATVGTCDSPLALRVGQTVTGDTRQARRQSQHTGSCLGSEEGEGGSAPEIVYALQIEQRQRIAIAAEQDYDGALFIRSECENARSELSGGCNDDVENARHSRITVDLDPGTYYVFADGFGDQAGGFSLTVTGTDVPSPQQVCQGATVLPVGQPVSGRTVGESDAFHATCANSTPGPDRVYRLDVPQESRAQIYQESDYDGALYVRRACADATSEVACNDDAGDVQHSRLDTVLPAGTYYVFTDGFGAAAQGSYTLQADLVPVAGGSGVPGDSCADAAPLTPGTPVDGNTFAARDDVAVPCGPAHDGYDLVYRLTVAHRARARFALQQADFTDAVIYVSTSCGAPVAGAGSAHPPVCHTLQVSADDPFETMLDPGTYFVVIEGAQPRSFGRFRLNVELEDTAEIDRLCRAARPIRPGQTVSGSTAAGTDRFHSTCAGSSRSPENLYRITIRRRSHIRLALATPNHDGALYLRTNCSDPSTETGCNDDAADTHHSLVETDLAPGTYTVFVDGFSSQNAGDYTLEFQATAL